VPAAIQNALLATVLPCESAIPPKVAKPIAAPAAQRLRHVREGEWETARWQDWVLRIPASC
jgi:hypothetical protein